jgi:pyridoxine kinase
MTQLLTIQSNVVVGHVGNAAARPALEHFGHRVWSIDTAILAHHPGHGAFRGEIRRPEALRTLVAGMAEVGAFARLSGVISGYLGDPDTAEIVADAVSRTRTASPDALYVCDPVIGDFDATGTGRSFVRPGVAEAIKAHLMPLADIVLPNRFELGLLTGMPVESVPGVIAAARALGRACVVVTSVDCPDVPESQIDVIVVTPKTTHRASIRRLPRRFDGSGDLFGGLFLGAYMAHRDAARAVEEALTRLLPVLIATGSAKDLDLSSLYCDNQTPARS